VSVNYREGQLVGKGAVLAQIDSRPFQVQLLQAEGQGAKDEATLKNAQLDLRALGGGWHASALPVANAVLSRGSAAETKPEPAVRP
jgi:membrane fusion protein, multidrug efflux system